MSIRFTGLRLRRLATVAAAGALALAPLTSAHAATVISLEHDVSGSTHIATPNSTVQLGPAVLHTDLDIDTGDFTGSLALPRTTSRFAVLGLLPVQADVDFVPAAPLTGHIDLAGSNATVTSTATYYVKLSNVRVAGIPTFAGPSCQTAAPVTIPANTPPGEGFDLINGGRLTGTYTIGYFQNCGLNTPLINLLVPGSGNTVDLQAANGRVVS
jgi:hypothetical protein